jgi:hypothetical protein
MGGQPVTNNYPRGTVEFVSATVTADVTLNAQTVKIAISRGDTHTWLDAIWVGASGTTRKARTQSPITFDATTYPASTYGVYVKVTDDPEVPVIRAGNLTIS